MSTRWWGIIARFEVECGWSRSVSLGGIHWREHARKGTLWGDRKEVHRSPDSGPSALPLLPPLPSDTRMSSWRMATVDGWERKTSWDGGAKRFPGHKIWPLGGRQWDTRDWQFEPHEIAISVDRKLINIDNFI